VGFNEDTVTDDLDLSFRLLTHGALVGILWDPPVQEEAVPGLSALWKQRQRWAEGGLQRFFDYWPTLTSSQLSARQRWDLACFFPAPVRVASGVLRRLEHQRDYAYSPHLLAVVDRGVQCVCAGLSTRLSRGKPRSADSISWFMEFASGHYISRPLVCGDSLGDIENVDLAETFGLGKNQPWW